MNIVKKCLALITLGVVGFGYSDVYAESVPAVPSSFTPYTYLGGFVAWVSSDWSGFGDDLTADDNGIGYGGKIGYQATRRFGVEFGGFVLPKSNQSGALTEDGPELSGAVNSWVGYAAATFRLPLFRYENFYLRSKAGFAYRNLDHNGDLYAGVGDGSYWTAILGASLNYEFGTKTPVVLGVEYSNVFGSRDSWSSNGHINANAAPAAQIVAATLGIILKV